MVVGGFPLQSLNYILCSFGFIMWNSCCRLYCVHWNAMVQFAVHKRLLPPPFFFFPLSEDDLQCNHGAALRQQMCERDLGSAHAVLYCAALTDEQRLLLRSQAGPRWLPAWLALWVKRQIWKTAGGALARCPDHRRSLCTPGPPHTAAFGGFKLHSHVLVFPHIFFLICVFFFSRSTQRWMLCEYWDFNEHIPEGIVSKDN